MPTALAKGDRPDVPVAAYTKAVQAFDEFDALVVEYGRLLQTQRAFVADGRIAAIAETGMRGDRLARSASMCGRRVAALLAEIRSGSLVGPRASVINARARRSLASARALGGAAAAVSAACVRQRNAIMQVVRRQRGMSDSDRFAGVAFAHVIHHRHTRLARRPGSELKFSLS